MFKKNIYIILALTLIILCIIPATNVHASGYESRILKQGCRGEDVKILQTKLNTLGYNAGKTDGIFGIKTKTAVMNFQKSARIIIDGIVGKNTYLKLNESENLKTDRVTVIGSVVNLRSGPGISYPKTGQVVRGTNLTVLGQSGEWLQVVNKNTSKAWIASWLTSSPTARGGTRTEPVTHPEKVVLGYYPENYQGDKSALTSLQSHYRSLTDLAAFAYTIDSSGQISGRHFSEGMTFAKQKGIKTYALVHNLINGKFDREIARQVLTSPTARQNAANNILALLKKHSYSGVHLDLENVAPENRKALTQFVSEVKNKLVPAGYKVSIAVPAKTSDSPKSDWIGAFDYAALGSLADEIAIMTYDEHYLGGEPGPVASCPWVEKVIKYATSQIPNNKILLGIATYGYEWGSNGSTRALSYPRISSLLNSYKLEAVWNPQFGVPQFSYQKEGVTYQVWFENSHSAKLKFLLVNQYGLKGIAIWRLGYEDPELWQRINEQILKAR